MSKFEELQSSVVTKKKKEVKINLSDKELTFTANELTFPERLLDVKNVFVERSSGYAPVDEAVKKAILQWKFTPAIGVDQKAHESIIGMTITLPKHAVTAK